VDLLLAFVLAMGITMALVPLLTRYAGHLRVLDAPGPRKVHARPIPRVGGIAMAVGVLLTLLFWIPGEPRLPAYLAAAAILVIVGVWDDRVELGHRPKFAAQLLAAVIVVVWGDVLIHSVTLDVRIELPALVSVPLTVLFIVGVTNAINLADGLDGLAGGTTLLSCCALALLALTLDERFVAAVSIILSGSLLGFLRFNTYPARIFMGDGGSQFLGCTVAVLAILITQHEALPISSALPLLLLGLPILDTLSVMAQRLAEGRSPFAADRNHLHHRLLQLGFAHHEAVLLIYLTQACLFVAAWYLRYDSDLTIVAVFAGFAAATLGLLHLGTRAGWRWRSAGHGTEPEGIARPLWWRSFRQRLPVVSLTIASLGAACYVLRTISVATPIPLDVGWLSAGLAAVILVGVMASRYDAMPGWLMHASLYVAAVLVVYLDVTVAPKWPSVWETAFVLLVAGCVMLSFRLTPDRRFELTPLDFIVVFIALALPNLPGSFASPRDLGLAAVKLGILFYTIELVSDRSPGIRLAVRSIAGVALAVAAARAFA
jgi:UDP-GlcNAc:undecaprenyl-phosphate GlcNAc-1-phosphate transferase